MNDFEKVFKDVDFYFLWGSGNKGKTLTLKCLYCIFMKEGGEPLSVVLGKGPKDPAEVEKRLDAIDFSSKNYIQNIAFKFRYNGKIIYIFSWGDAFDNHKYSIKNGIESIEEDVDIYIGACHSMDRSKITTLLGKEVVFFEKERSNSQNNYMLDNREKAKKMFETIKQESF